MSGLTWLFVIAAAAGAELVARAPWRPAARAAAWAGLIVLAADRVRRVHERGAKPGVLNRGIAFVVALLAAVAAAKAGRDDRPRARGLLWVAAAIAFAAGVAGEPWDRPDSVAPASAVLLATCAALADRPTPEPGAA